MQDDVASKIEAIATRVAASEGMEVVEVAVKGGGASRLIRISIDKPEGVTHGDCELVSQQVGTILDLSLIHIYSSAVSLCTAGSPPFHHPSE